MYNLSFSIYTQTHQCLWAAHWVQVQDDFSRLCLHFLYNAVSLDAVRRQTEATQQPHLHDGHPRCIEAQTVHQPAEDRNTTQRKIKIN